ncbi:MAG: PorT family protein [Alistipes putredinis]|nr:MAG: PorT family protein [Alistipes putredinis]
MPLVTKYYLIGGLNVQLGAQFGYLINAKNNLPGASRQSIKGETNRYNVGILTGLAYDFDFGLVLEGRYTLALTDTFVNTAKQRGGALQVMVGWKF